VLAEVHGVPVEAVAEATTRNARRLFRLEDRKAAASEARSEAKPSEVRASAQTGPRSVPQASDA
jgi:hypothetical protein